MDIYIYIVYHSLYGLLCVVCYAMYFSTYCIQCLVQSVLYMIMIHDISYIIDHRSYRWSRYPSYRISYAIYNMSIYHVVYLPCVIFPVRFTDSIPNCTLYASYIVQLHIVCRIRCILYDLVYSKAYVLHVTRYMLYITPYIYMC